MRRRLTGAFALLALVVIVLVVTVRALTVQNLVRDQESDHQQLVAELIANVIDEELASGATIDKRLLVPLIDVESRIEYVGPEGSVTAEGQAFTTAGEELMTEVPAGEGSIVLTTTARETAAVSGRQITSLLVLAVLVSILAGVAGWWLAVRLSAPFTALAGAAAALGRGRFDLSLPDSSIPEARSIGQALRGSAAQIERRLAHERDFAEYASHELRTPLTALQLELEDLTLRDDVPDDAKAAAKRCMLRVDDVNAAASELVSITRQGLLVEGGQVALHDLACQVAQVWSERLAPARRPVTVETEGDLDVTFTPGPIEHLLELLLTDVVGGTGSVRLVFVGGPDHVRIGVPAGVASPAPHPGLTIARELAVSQGGRIAGDLTEAGLDLVMPRR